MKNRIKTIGKIKGTAYRNTSYYGNPSYFITFETEEGETIKGYTAWVDIQSKGKKKINNE